MHRSRIWIELKSDIIALIFKQDTKFVNFQRRNPALFTMEFII